MRAYVTFFTNTPQLVQIYFLYFALPDAGILLSSYAAVLIGMTLNAGAYLTDIQRAGFESVRASEMEAAEVLGFSRLQQIRYVILPHVARVLFPPLSNLYILMTLGTSMAAIFGVEELTGRAFNVNSQTFRSIEVFSVTAALYVVITLVATAAARPDRPLRFPRPDEAGLTCWTRLIVRAAAVLRLLQRHLSGQGRAWRPWPCRRSAASPARSPGSLLALVRLDTVALARADALARRSLLTELFRRIPFLVTLMLVFFVFQLSGVDLPLFAVALIAVFLIATAYLAEIIRAGFESVHRNQWDAAAAMNFSLIETMRYVIAAAGLAGDPAAGLRILRALHQGYGARLADRRDRADLCGQGAQQQRLLGRAVFGTLLVLYFLISYPLARLGAHLEARLAQPRHR